MFGFGKKKEDAGEGAVSAGSSAEAKEILEKVIFHTMPRVEGAAALSLANTEASSREKPKEEPKAAPRASLAPPPPAPKPAATPPPLLAKQPPLPHGAGKIMPVAPPSKKKWLVAGIIAVVVLLLGGGGWYWYNRTRVTSDDARGSFSLSPGVSEPEATGTETIGSSAPIEPIAPSFETHFLADRGLVSSRDSDADLLTDVEEELFGTDPNLPDTDFDGWPDGWEVVHLYDPVRDAAGRLIENPQMTAFQNDQFGYTVLFPNSWVAQAVDARDQKDVVITAATGEFIRITAEPYGDQAVGTLTEEYVRGKYPGGSTYTLHQLANKFEINGFETADALTVFLEGHNTVYMVRYEPGLRSDINFKRVMAMLVAGFFVSPSLDEIPVSATSTPSSAVTSTALIAPITTTPE